MQKKIIRKEHPWKTHMVWDGFRVAQYIPGYGREMSDDTSPFLMLDYNAPWQIPPQKNGHRPWVGFHPHRGFETVTLVYAWEVEHQDTAWNGGIIGPDEVQWMTAGSGLLHNEFMTADFSEKWGMQHAVQLWVNLPKAHKMIAPRYQALNRDTIPEVEFDGGVVRVIAGELKMQDAQWKMQNETWAAETFSPVELYDVRFVSAWGIHITFPEWYTTLLLVIEGQIQVDDAIIENGDIVHCSREWNELSITSLDTAKVLIMWWAPLGEDVVAYGPFVMNTEAEIREAFADFQAGKMGSIV